MRRHHEQKLVEVIKEQVNVVTASSLTKFAPFMGKLLTDYSQHEESEIELMAVGNFWDGEEPGFVDRFMLEEEAWKYINRGQ